MCITKAKPIQNKHERKNTVYYVTEFQILTKHPIHISFTTFKFLEL